MKSASTLATVFLVAWLFTTPERAVSQTAPVNPTNKCFGELIGDPRIQVLSTKINIGGPSSIEMMALKELPTEDEKVALSIWGAGRQACMDLGRDYRERYTPPGWTNAYEWQQSSILELIAGLYGGNITYGEFNTQRNRIVPEGNARMRDAEARAAAVRAQQIDSANRAAAAMVQQINSDFARQTQQNDERANAAIRILQQPRTNQTIRTNCTRLGDTVNCTTN